MDSFCRLSTIDVCRTSGTSGGKPFPCPLRSAPVVSMKQTYAAGQQNQPIMRLDIIHRAALSGPFPIDRSRGGGQVWDGRFMMAAGMRQSNTLAGPSSKEEIEVFLYAIIVRSGSKKCKKRLLGRDRGLGYETTKNDLSRPRSP